MLRGTLLLTQPGPCSQCSCRQRPLLHSAELLMQSKHHGQPAQPGPPQVHSGAQRPQAAVRAQCQLPVARVHGRGRPPGRRAQAQPQCTPEPGAQQGPLPRRPDNANRWCNWTPCCMAHCRACHLAAQRLLLGLLDTRPLDTSVVAQPGLALRCTSAASACDTVAASATDRPPCMPGAADARPCLRARA